MDLQVSCCSAKLGWTLVSSFQTLGSGLHTAILVQFCSTRLSSSLVQWLQGIMLHEINGAMKTHDASWVIQWSTCMLSFNVSSTDTSHMAKPSINDVEKTCSAYYSWWYYKATWQSKWPYNSAEGAEEWRTIYSTTVHSYLFFYTPLPCKIYLLLYTVCGSFIHSWHLGFHLYLFCIWFLLTERTVNLKIIISPYSPGLRWWNGDRVTFTSTCIQNGDKEEVYDHL